MDPGHPAEYFGLRGWNGAPQRSLLAGSMLAGRARSCADPRQCCVFSQQDTSGGARMDRPSHASNCRDIPAVRGAAAAVSILAYAKENVFRRW